MPLVAVPGRAGVEPELSLTYDSSAAGSGVLGVGFSISGPSAITPCPKNLAQDGEIRGVRYDGSDGLCLSGQRLVPVREEPGIVEYRTFPDSFVKVVGHYPSNGGPTESALFFEAFLPSGLVVEYGKGESGKPLAKGGAPRAWLATKAHDGRGNAMSYDYCFAEADGYTAEYALDEIRYTSFEGDPALEATRAVELVYGTKDPADIRTVYSGGMALQSSLRLDELEMLGPGDTLVRRYGFTYELSPATRRPRLTEIEECAGDGVCKPPTRFQFSSHSAGLKRIATSIPAPTSALASPMLLDIDADGIDDLVVPDVDAAGSTPRNPITAWLVGRNRGSSASPSYFAEAAPALSEAWPVVGDPSEAADPRDIQPDLGTAIDYDEDGWTDILLHDVYGSTANHVVLLAQPDRTFKVHDTGIPRPFPLGTPPRPPALTSKGGSVHLADLDGDGVPDLIQCEDHSENASGDPSKPAWTVHLWKPAQGGLPAGFDRTGAPIDPLGRFACDTELHTLDLNADGKVDLVVESMLTSGDGTMVPASTYSALSRRSDGSFEVFDTKLPIVLPGGHVVFLDVNGDGLPDAVESGFQDHALRTYLNTGPTFAARPENSLPAVALGDQDTYFGLAAPIDFDGDGRQDLLMPVPAGTPPNPSNALPAWVILQATGALHGPTFTLVDPQLPFEAALVDAVTLADPRGPRIGDLDGDGAQDVVLTLGDVFNVFHNLAADQDLLVAVSDGMNAHDPTDSGFTPNVSISYGHLTDASITNDLTSGDPARESALYISHADPANGCAYPRSCAVGPRRVVSAYATNNGADRLRHFGVRYRDGRYDRLGRGFLGFGERIVTDVDTRAGTAELYDNVSFDEHLHAFPFAGQVQHAWSWEPGLPTQPAPDQIELSFMDVTRTLVPTSDGKSYFTLPTQRHVRRVQGHVHGGLAETEAYVQEVEAHGGATLLRDSVTKVSDFDAFGNVRVEDVSTAGVDLTFHVERTFKNDADRWVLGQLQTQKECSAAAGISQCRTLTRTTTIYGEVDTESTASDDGSPDTKLSVSYPRDAFGNIREITAGDAYGHHRSSRTTYDAEGIYPHEHINAARQTTITEFDPGLGVLTRLTDPNQLVTQWKYDGFGRLGIETRPDGTETTVTLARTKDGGPNHNAWRVTERSVTTGGADDEVEYDSLGRPVRWLWHGPATPRTGGEPPRLMQEIAYDDLGEHIARRSVPVSEGTPESKMLFDVYEYDGAGREVRHTTPWNAVVTTVHDGLRVEVTDPLKHVTIVEQDSLGRPVSITDAALGVTRYSYGPFGLLSKVGDPGGAITRMMRDALGRVRHIEDPDRGTTDATHDGFGELMSTTDALHRVTTFEYDELGRTRWRVDQEGAERLTTTWTWDMAAHGIGKLQGVTSPDGEKTYTYNDRGQLDTISLAIGGERDPLEARLDYDPFGRVETITYPAPGGAAPFAVTQEYDPYGHMLAVRDSATKDPYWRLTDVDDAGRFRSEALGHDVTTERSYFADKQSLKSIVTRSGVGVVQNLAYEYDPRLSLASRTDALQPEHPTERFRYDPLDRLTCAYFSVAESDSAPCALSYGHAPNGNLSVKSDVGALSYDDPLHPHAVTSAGSERFGYNAVGNQDTRPGGTTVTYTPFDLPKTITQGASTVTFGYDGDEQRIRKSTPREETIYFGDLYERVTDAASRVTAHRYYVHSPERVVAVVTRGGADPGTRYVHVDHLGSVDVLTDESGAVVERRSYDPFGQRRNPVWGQPAPASFPSRTTRGFTGHEGDEDLGLVNMKGRVFDPKIGRFLTTDPIVAVPLSGQSWNPYSYVLGNPLALVDPSGFQPNGQAPPSDPDLPNPEYANDPEVQRLQQLSCQGAECRNPPAKQVEGSREAVQVGAATRPSDVSTTGSSSGYAPQPVTTAPRDWSQNPYVQIEGGFLGGLLLGSVPFASMAQQLLDVAKVLPQGTPEARRGLAVGQIVGGLVGVMGGFTGEVVGGIASVTGIGAALGLPAIAVSTGLVLGGAANIEVGIRGLMSTGSGNTGPQSKAPAARGVRVGGEAWKAFEPGAEACRNGCEAVAQAIQKAIGGEVKVITGPGRFLGRIRNSAGEFVNPAGSKAGGWNNHHVVVKDGMVYDALTGPNGMAAPAYKQLWEYGDVLNFDF